ncbi:ParB/RepB/Spo0J family partition protein [Oscillibacter sp.]|uniref:ParB/RepB/Spo0J family partition protein n=1 Tax=Oscillibacter sp. TaxID=1945593 RepID=UPI00289E9112|nr:ParB/RepB/Spo0J family partition protein [Oscillibacter sp.]
MAKQNKAPEQDSAPAVQQDADIMAEEQQGGQPEAPPFEADTQTPEMTADPSETVTPSEVTEQLIAEESGANDATAKEAEAAAAVIDFPQQEPPEEDTRQEWEKPLAEIEAEQQPKRRGRPPKEDKETSGQVGPKSEKSSKGEKAAKAPKPPKSKPTQEEPPTPVQPETPPEPLDATRPGEMEQIIYLNLSDLHPFKNHPFEVRNDEEMQAMVSSVKDKGVTQPAIVRPREDGGYEIVSGHRRHRASELAGMFNMPCIVRNMTDEQAIMQMVEDNTNQREYILPSERSKALKMQLDALKRQGSRGPAEGADVGKRSNEIVAERNKMTVKQMQRFIKLGDLVPDLMEMVDKKAIGFTPAVEMAYIKPKQQRYIAVAIEGQQSGPSLSQAQRMRELDQKGMLNADVIDGIMLEEKKEVDKVIISSQELGQYFGKDKTPREMKDQILALLDDWKSKQPPEQGKAEKKAEQEK